MWCYIFFGSNLLAAIPIVRCCCRRRCCCCWFWAAREHGQMMKSRHIFLSSVSLSFSFSLLSRLLLRLCWCWCCALFFAKCAVRPCHSISIKDVTLHKRAQKSETMCEIHCRVFHFISDFFPSKIGGIVIKLSEWIPNVVDVVDVLQFRFEIFASIWNGKNSARRKKDLRLSMIIDIYECVCVYKF